MTGLPPFPECLNGFFNPKQACRDFVVWLGLYTDNGGFRNENCACSVRSGEWYGIVAGVGVGDSIRGEVRQTCPAAIDPDRSDGVLAGGILPHGLDPRQRDQEAKQIACPSR
jgi:hypothetical protein